MKHSAIENFARSTAAVETGFLVAGVTVAAIAAIEAVVTVTGWMAALVAA